MADALQLIAAPPATPPRLGLLASAVRPDAPQGWLNGIRFRPERHLGSHALEGGGVWYSCDDPDSVPDKALQATAPAVIEWRPWTIVESDDNCPADGFVGTDYAARARRILLANESRKIERELWSGEIAQAAGFTTNDWLTKAGTAEDLGSADPTWALAELQQYLADTITGRGMIHARPRAVTSWVRKNMTRREGNLLLDAFDNIIVSGTGYLGTGPGDVAVDIDTEWAYATSLVSVLEDDVQIVPDNKQQAFDHRRNRFDYVAERTVLAFHDHSAKASIRIELDGTFTPPAS